MKPLSIYIHWPFCLSLCPYCDFNSHLADEINHDIWLESYLKEIVHFKEKIAGRFIKSIFFGGGTPSLMNPILVAGIINFIAKIAIVDEHTEITLEANPTSYEAQKFKDFKASGINRVSIGIQSLNEQSLKILGRKHSAYEAIAAVNSASQIFKRYSFDLIYAIPNQTLLSWQNELKDALQIAGDHISLYQLTIEKGTPFFKLYNNKELILPSNDISADMYEWTNNHLTKNSFSRYEISNYATNGNECIHNLCYWHYDEYVGIGPGAHSRLHHSNHSIQAIMMTHKPEKWLEKVSNEGHGIQTSNYLTKDEIIKEAFMMGSRLKNGINEEHFYKITRNNFNQILNLNIVQQYQNLDLVILNNNNFQLTEKGLLLHNYIIPRLLK